LVAGSQAQSQNPGEFPIVDLCLASASKAPS
jgi:hypothetical protein